MKITEYLLDLYGGRFRRFGICYEPRKSQEADPDDRFNDDHTLIVVKTGEEPHAAILKCLQCDVQIAFEKGDPDGW